MALKFLSPAYELMATAASPAINFGRGLLGYQDPFLTQTMQDRMLELEAQKGLSGSIGYEDYGLPVSTPGGRFTGGLPSLFLSSPVDFALAGSVGRYGYGPEGRTGLEYDFTPDQNTGSTGNAILDFINRGGLKEYFSKMGTAQAAEVTPENNLQQRVNVMNQFDLPFNYSADDLQARAKRAMTQPGFNMQLEKNDPNIPDEIEFLDGRKFTATQYDPYRVTRARTNEPIDIEDYLGTSTPQDLGFIGSAPSVFTPTSVTPITPVEYTSYSPSVEMEQPLQEKGIGSMLKNLIPGSLFATLLSGILPEESPQMKAAKSFYRNQYGLTPGGSVASGIMAGYNPVSGGLLNMLTQGAVGRPPNVGLQRAYQQRINMIKNTLAKKYADGDYSGTQLDERLAELEKLKAAEQMAMEKPTIDRARETNRDVYREADRQGFTGPGGGFSTSGKEGAFSSKSGRGRQDY